jgi:hypothetical protein
MTSPYPYTANTSVIAQVIVDKIVANKDNFVIPVTGVMYGDQDRIPTTPYVCIEPNDKSRVLAGAPNMTKNEFEIFILIYFNNVRDISINRKQADELAYDIEHFLHQDLQLRSPDGTANLIHGFVRLNESGYTVKQNTLYRSARLTYFGMNKTSLPEN